MGNHLKGCGETILKIKPHHMPWNCFSLLLPIVSLFCAFVGGCVGDMLRWAEAYSIFFGFTGFVACAVVPILGFVAARRSISQMERFWGITAVGIILNSFFFLLFLLGMSSLLTHLFYSD